MSRSNILGRDGESPKIELNKKFSSGMHAVVAYNNYYKYKIHFMK